MDEKSGKRVFTAERRQRGQQNGDASMPGIAGPDLRDELREALAAFKEEIKRETVAAIRAGADDAQTVERIARAEADRNASKEELDLLKNELRALSRCIDETKEEVAAICKTGNEGNRLALVKGELDAIVADTEAATGSILDAAEHIDERAHFIVAHSESGPERQAAEDIAETATRIFEFCNFQDLTGQRITKVVNTLKYVEEKIADIIAIWGSEIMQDAAAPVNEPAKGMDGLDRMINTSRKETERVSQDDIDKMFG